MSKEKLEKDFRDFNAQIDALANEELEHIKEKVAAVKEEAARIGQTIELALKELKAK